MSTSQVQVQAQGILLEEIDTDLAALTIDLTTVVAADALGALLKGLAGFYRAGVSLDDPKHDPWVWFKYSSGGGESESTHELLISKLIIGTPNKLKVVGRKRWIQNLATILTALAQLSGNIEGQPPQHDQVVQVCQQAPAPASIRTPPPPSPSATELGDAILRINAALTDLEARRVDGKISDSEYTIRRNALETAQAEFMKGLKIVSAIRPIQSGSAGG